MTAQARDAGTYVWYINPQKGWNAERITYADGPETNEAIVILEQFGETWLPAQTDFYHRGELTNTVVIESAKLNEPNGPRKFTLGDIGMQPGEQLAPQHKSVAIGKPPVWNGDAVAEWDAWIADVKSSRRAWGPRMQRVNRHEPFDSPYMTDEQRELSRLSRLQRQRSLELRVHEGLWTRYVRSFIATYQLDTEQSQKAMVILMDCQSQANQYLISKKDPFQRVQNDIAQADAASDQGLLKKGREAMEQLRKPIDGIFSRQLVPRLDKLPTREQRKRADSQPIASRPATGAAAGP